MTIKSTNPMTREILWEGPVASEKEVDQAIVEAHMAFPSWSQQPMKERENALLKFQKILTEQKASFAETISKETGKPLWESNTEVDSMILKINISIEAQSIRCKELTKKTPQGLSITRHKPLGVAAVLGPYNFPGHLPCGHIVPALLAGNTIVFKPSELTPLVGEKLVELWKESGLPKGVINYVQGTHETGKILVNHPDINALFFTGSWKSGKLIAQEFGKHPNKLLALEMGGNNPLVVGKIANFEAAAYQIIQSSFLTSGQRCTSARRLIISNGSDGEKLIEALLMMCGRIKIGAYNTIPEPFMGPVINTHASHNLITAQNALLSMGGKALLEMKELQEGTPLISPAVIDITNMSKRFDEEIFGPLLQVIRVHNLDDAIKEANNTHFGLSAGILTDEKKEYETFYQNIKAGIINWNTPTTGATSSAPFGGVGQSGNFRPSAFYAADYCNYPVASMESTTLSTPEIWPQGLNNDLTRT